jgi:hypothetical protein
MRCKVWLMPSRYTFEEEGSNKIHAGVSQYRRRCFFSGLDIMTSDGGRLTPDVPRVSVPKPEPHAAETAPINSEVNHVAV